MRNLLGRLHARSNDQRERIAALWYVSVFGPDSGQHIGRIYQVMTDIRAIRSVWTRLSDPQRQIIHVLSADGAKPHTIAELAEAIGSDEEATHTVAVDLFRWAILAREGDSQELPIGEKPRVFMPGELVLLFRRVQEERDAADISDWPLRRLLDLRDDFEIETSATKWGIRVQPGITRRQDLIDAILDAVSTPGRLESVINALKQPATAIWNVMHNAEARLQPFGDVVAEAGLAVAEGPLGLTIEHTTRLRGALEALESSLLVNHTWLEDGSQALFIPEELLNPLSVPVKVPLSPIEPLPAGSVPAVEPVHPFAISWDLMTIVREIAAKGPPVWIPGQPLPTHWLRMINSRLWFHGESVPPEGYVATLLQLALDVGALEHADRTPGMEKAAIKPILGRNARWWRGLSFIEQTERLRQQWIAAESWIEGRESGEIDIRAADWIRFRHRLLTSVARLDPDEWVLVRDASLRLAEQDLSILGDIFEVATGRPETRTRRGSIATTIEVELTTAFVWFGFVETQNLGEKGIAMRITPSAIAAAREIDAMPSTSEPTSGPILTINHQGFITLRRPAPLHIWSLTAFAENVQLAPQAIYQLRTQSIGAALGAGFDLEQITRYLENQSGEPLPDPLETRLREWTAGYKRVKLRRAVSLDLDVHLGKDELASTLREAGFTLVPTSDNSVMVMLSETGEDATSAEQHLTRALRKAGYAGQWVKSTEL